MDQGDAIEYAKANLSPSVLLGFNTNVDAVRHLRGEEISGLDLPESISDLPEYMTRGMQKEVAVSEDVLSFLTDNLGVDEYRVGGQVGNMARDAARLGVTTYAHVAKKCRRQMELLDVEGIWVAGPGGFTSPAHFTDDCTPDVHYVMEFKKGDRIDGKMVPNSNRYIASYDPENFEMRLDPLFLEYAGRRVDEVSKAVISGFHLLQREYSSRVKEIAGVITSWKEKNPDLFLHLEMAEFQDDLVLKETMEHILPRVDSVGFNEIELTMMTGLEDRDEALAKVAGQVDTVLFHTGSYSACISDVPVERMEGALGFATLVGAYKTAHGRGPTMEELEGYRPGRPSREGMEAKAALEAKDFGKNVAVVPSLPVEEPESLVGVGDCFTVAFVLVI